MLIQDRLQLILKMYNLSPSALADRIGVQRSNVSHVLSGRNKPGLDFLQKIIIQFPEINAHWLITGKMNEHKSIEIAAPNFTNHSNMVHKTTEKKDVVKMIEFYSDGTFKEYLPTIQ